MAGFFDDEDVIAPIAPVRKQAATTSVFFEPADVVTVQPAPGPIVQPGAAAPAVAQSATAAPVTPVQQKSSFFDEQDVVDPVKPTGMDNRLTDKDFQAIGQKYGVDPKELKDLAPYYDAQVQPESLGEGLKVGLKSAAGQLGRTVGLGIPQFAYKKLQDEKTRKAIDELKTIADSQRSIVDTATDLIAPGSLGGAATAAGRLAKAAGMGAIIGTTESKEGKEAQSALTGAGIGTVLGAGGELLGKVISKFSPNKVEQALVQKQSQQQQLDIGKEAEEVAQKTVQSEKTLEDLSFGRKETLTPQEVDTIVKEQMGEDSLARYLNPNTAEGAILRNQVGGTEEAVKKKLAENILETRVRDFAEDVTGTRPANFEDASETLTELASRQGPEAMQNRYKQFVGFKQAEKAIEQGALRATDQRGFVGNAANFMSDNQFVLRGIDNQYGRDTEGVLRQLNKDFNRSTFAQKEFRTGVEDIFQKAQKAGVDDAIVNTDRIYSAVDRANAENLTPEEEKIALEFMAYFRKGRDFVNELVRQKDPRIAPLSIPNRENYVPKMLKPTDELTVAIERKIEQAKQEIASQIGMEIGDLAKLSSEQFKEVRNTPVMQELIRTATLLNNNSVKSGAELSARLKDMLFSREGNIALETKARAALERKDVIPEYLLETNLYKLARRWSDNTIKHLYLRNTVDKLRYEAKVLKKAGADGEAAYIERLVQDLMGVRKGTAAEATMQARIQMNRKVDALIEKVGKDTVQGGMLTAVKAMPEVMSELTRQIYPNLLGFWNIRAVIQNSTQGITKTAPELGTKYGYATLLRSAVSTVANMKRLVQKAEALGNVPSEFIRDGERAVAEGIQRSALYTIPSKALEGMARTGMIFFTKMEQFNRALVTSVGETMARDLARGSKLAQESLRKFPRSVQVEVQRNPERTADILAQYLNDATMYNYNRASMSEYGRTMGPLFSAFSKWPTATVGEVIQEMRDKGLLRGSFRNVEKFVAPLLLLQAADYLMGERSNDPDSLSDIQKKIVGSGGLSQSAPVGALGGIMKGEIFTPPAVDAFIQTVVNPILEGDSAKIERGAGSAVMNFAPTAGLFRFLFDDVTTYITGERPEGTNNLERAVEGSRKAVK